MTRMTSGRCCGSRAGEIAEAGIFLREGSGQKEDGRADENFYLVSFSARERKKKKIQNFGLDTMRKFDSALLPQRRIEKKLKKAREFSKAAFKGESKFNFTKKVVNNSELS